MTQSARPNVRLTLAVNDSDQVRDLVTGKVPVDGIDLTCLLFPVEEIFFRFTRFREWEVSELSFGKYCSLRARGDTSLVGLPVFLSRAFRHAAIYVRPDGPVDRPADLRGSRIGLPEWTVTATVWARAVLAHEYAVELTGVDWVQAGIDQPGRVETLPVELPTGIEVTPVADRSLNDLLVAGEIDALIAPRPPSAFADGSGRIVRLFSDHATVEREYYARTGIFPIMHLVVLRHDVHEHYPWAAANLVKAFTEAKDRSLDRLSDEAAPRFPLPLGPAAAAASAHVFGRDLWPYGVEPNRSTIEAFLEIGVEQGLCDRRLAVEDLFPASVQDAFRV